ncbi:MAG: hypothetical protein M1832_001350 [Thelocarpon impressellum]|nr:MAG: hypothetical protein M1832_001350 [Thelocarpon impressellum]
MCRFEVASVVLGVLPLVVAAVEHYDAVARPFYRFRNFASEVKAFQGRLRTQKAIFREACRALLLAHIPDASLVKKLLEGDAVAGEPEVDEAFARSLGESADTYKGVIKSIEDQLSKVEEEASKLGCVIYQSQQGHVGDAVWRANMAKKIRFAFSKLRMAETMTSLRDLNQDFVTLVGLSSSGAARRPRAVASRGMIDLADFGIIQKASQELYEALEKAWCTTHTEHMAQLCLEVTRVQPNRRAPAQVRFNLAVKHLAFGKPVWFGIESILSESTTGTGSESVREPKRARAEHCSSLLAKKARKTVRFAPGATPPTTGVQLPELSQHHICMRVDLCNQMQRVCRKSPGLDEDRMPIGDLGETASCKHHVYLSTPSSSAGSRPSTSLAALITDLSKRSRKDGLPSYERLRLAKLLATAVLQFHATPWLKGSWCSDDVVFFGVDSSQGPRSTPALTSPHINVPFTEYHGSLVRGRTDPSRAFVRNALLYRLGLVLLELAYEAPINSLKLPRDLPDGPEDRHSEFFTAKRLSGSIGKEMGSTFGEIVRKCLQCDFGKGDDLAKPALQEAFHQDVVCELGRLEEGFRKLQLGD